jgi:pimeloyl-ACP methyl ester carboxylesterase
MVRFLAFLMLAFAAVPAAAQPAPDPVADPGTPAPGFASDRIGVTVLGSGPDVVLIPGLNSTPNVWRATMAALPGYRYHLIHVSGFAGRPAGANATGSYLVPVAEEVARYITEAHLDHPAIVGHSMGGSWAMLVAGRHPGLVSKVMVVDMMPFLGAMIMQQAGITQEQLPMVADRMRTGMAAVSGEQRRIMTSTMIAQMVRTESERPAQIAAGMASDPAVSAQGFADLIVTNLLGEVANIRVPMLVLYVQPAAGPGGAVPTPEQIDNFYRISYRGAPQAVVRRIPDSAHFIMLDQPAVFQTALREFLVAPAPAAAPAPATPAPSPS